MTAQVIRLEPAIWTKLMDTTLLMDTVTLWSPPTIMFRTIFMGTKQPPSVDLHHEYFSFDSHISFLLFHQ